MNLNQLRYAKTLADTRSFVRTAQICHATQPTISNAISKLEQELGEKMFCRTTRTVEVTAFGLHLLPLIDSILANQVELKSAAKSYLNPSQKLLRIGLSPLVDSQYLEQILDAYKENHPDTKFFFKECFMNDLPGRINRQQLDIALVAECNIADYRFHCPSYSEPLLFIPQELGIALNYAKAIKVSSLAKTPIILTGASCGLNDTIDALFQKQKVPLTRYTGQAMSYRVIEEWANLGVGAGILPYRKITSASANKIPLLHKNGKPITIKYFWVWNSEPLIGNPLANLLEFIH